MAHLASEKQFGTDISGYNTTKKINPTTNIFVKRVTLKYPNRRMTSPLLRGVRQARSRLMLIDCRRSPPS